MSVNLTSLAKYKLVAVAIIVGLIIAAFVVEQHRITALEHENGQLALATSNLIARADSTHEIGQASVAEANALRAAYGDSMRLFQRRVVQQQQQQDALDKANDQERRGLYDVAIRLDSMRRSIASHGAVTVDTVRPTAGVDSGRPIAIRHADFDLRSVPFTVHASVDMPPAPDTAHLSLAIALDTLSLHLRLACSAPDRNGIRAASIEAAMPDWAHVRFGQVQQSPDICASPALTGRAPTRSLFKWKPVVIGAGRVLIADSKPRWGLFVGTGFAIGSM